MPSQKDAPVEPTPKNPPNSKVKQEVKTVEKVTNVTPTFSETDQILALVHTMERVTERTTDAINKISEKLDNLNTVIIQLTKKMDEGNKTTQPLQQDLTALSQQLLGQTVNILQSKNPPQNQPAKKIEDGPPQDEGK